MLNCMSVGCINLPLQFASMIMAQRHLDCIDVYITANLTMYAQTMEDMRFVDD